MGGNPNNKITNVFILSPISSTDVTDRPRLPNNTLSNPEDYGTKDINRVDLNEIELLSYFMQLYLSEHIPVPIL
jgi:hypothetical protein